MIGWEGFPLEALKIASMVVQAMFTTSSTGWISFSSEDQISFTCLLASLFITPVLSKIAPTVRISTFTEN